MFKPRRREHVASKRRRGREAPFDSAGFPVGTYGVDPAAKLLGSDVAGDRRYADISTPSGASNSRSISQIELRIDVARPDDVLKLNDKITEELGALGVTHDHVITGPVIEYEGPGGLASRFLILEI